MKKLIIVVTAAALLAGCNLPDWLKKEKEEKKEVNKTYTVTVPVTTSPAMKTELVKKIKANGVAEAGKIARVSAEISGNVEAIRDLNNSKVTAGTPILEIDKERLALDLEQARVNLQKAEAEYEAWKMMNSEADDDQLQLQTGLKDAQINLRKLELDFAKADVKAPFSGVISGLELSKGQLVNTGTQLFTIYDLSEILLRTQVLESEVGRLREDNSAIVRFPSIQNRIYKGKVESIAPVIDKTTRTCEVVIRLANDGLIKDGMFADVKIEAESFSDRVVVFKDAMLMRDGKKLVFAVEDGKAKWQYVKTGEENDKFIEITDGVEADQDIVIVGNFSLSHDAKVKVANTVSYEEILERF